MKKVYTLFCLVDLYDLNIIVQIFFIVMETKQVLGLLVFNAFFKDISIICNVGQTRVLGENHQPTVR